MLTLPNPRRPSPPFWITLTALIAMIAFSVMAWFAFNPVQPVPDMSFTLLSGQKISTQQLSGKVTIVHFWATSCATCIQEMPQMVKTYNRFRAQGLEFIAVAMNYDPPAFVAHYSQTRQLPFKVAIDDGSAAKNFGDVRLTPTTFVISRKGRILKHYLGAPDFKALDKLIESELIK